MASTGPAPKRPAFLGGEGPGAMGPPPPNAPRTAARFSGDMLPNAAMMSPGLASCTRFAEDGTGWLRPFLSRAVSSEILLARSDCKDLAGAVTRGRHRYTQILARKPFAD